MQISVLDVIKTKDGKQGTVVETLEHDSMFLVEIADDKGRTQELLTLSQEDIDSVVWHHSK